MRVAQSAAFFGGVRAQDYVLLVLAASGCHILFLVANYALARHALKLPLADVKCVTIMASQKSIPMTLILIEALPESLIGNLGLVAIPVIIAHLFQTLFDSMFGQRWAEADAKKTDSDSSALLPQPQGPAPPQHEQQQQQQQQQTV
jgi:predicted Na+-dependent transporter